MPVVKIRLIELLEIMTADPSYLKCLYTNYVAPSAFGTLHLILGMLLVYL